MPDIAVPIKSIEVEVNNSPAASDGLLSPVLSKVKAKPTLRLKQRTSLERSSSEASSQMSSTKSGSPFRTSSCETSSLFGKTHVERQA